MRVLLRAAAAVLAAALPTAADLAEAAEQASLQETLRAIFERGDGLTALRSLELSGEAIAIGLQVPRAVRLDDLPAEIENRYEEAVGAIAALAPALMRVDLLVAHPGQPLAPPPRGSAPMKETPRRVESVRWDPARYPHGQALRGKTVALSPGHGYIYYDNLGRYSTQRGRVSWNGCGTCRGIVEDFETHEIVVDHLVPLLEGAGARVVLVRERARSSTVAIIDDRDSGYREAAGMFGNGSSAGGHGADYRTSSDPAAEVAWTIAAPASGPSWLSLWFVAGANRYDAARLEVEGPGGVFSMLLDQTSHGRRWVPVGLFDLDRGARLRVRLMAPIAPANPGYVIADAVRIGAGDHSSGHRWWEMGAAPFAAHQDAPSEVRAYGDVSIRPRYAEWFGADVYLSVHSNASGQANSTAVGTSTYRFNCLQYPDHSRDPPPADCDDPTGSDRLQALVHDRMVERVRADWDRNWADRGHRVANFGELRELDGIPGALIETAFHDNVRLADGSNLRMTENQALHDPRWRRAAAFGMYQGLSEFLVGAGTLLASPPASLVARRIDGTSVSLTFDAPAGAQSYRVYTARAGRMFDQGRVFTGASEVVDGLAPEETACFRVASLNAAGEGLPSAVVCARPSPRRAQVLLVDSFDREDAWVSVSDNRRSTSLVHALAMAPAGAAFDGATELAVDAGQVALSDYDAVVFALGRESTEHGVLTERLRGEVATFSAAGGAVFAAGSEIGWALDTRGDETSRMFLAEVFGAAHENDDAGADAIVMNMETYALDDGSAGGLQAQSSDVFRTLAGAYAEVQYSAGNGVAGVAKGKNLVLGVALDSIAGADARAAVLGAWLARAVTIEPLPPADAGVIAMDAAATPDPDAGFVADAGTVSADAADSVPDSAAAPQQDASVSMPDTGLMTASETPEEKGCECSHVKKRRVRSGLAGLLVASFALGRRRPRITRRGRSRRGPSR